MALLVIETHSGYSKPCLTQFVFCKIVQIFRDRKIETHRVYNNKVTTCCGLNFSSDCISPSSTMLSRSEKFVISHLHQENFTVSRKTITGAALGLITLSLLITRLEVECESTSINYKAMNNVALDDMDMGSNTSSLVMNKLGALTLRSSYDIIFQTKMEIH